MTGAQLSALRIYDRAAWAKIVRAALRGKTVAQAAEDLGVSWRTLMRWRRELTTPTATR